MTDHELVAFLQWGLPRLGMRWPGFRKVWRQVRKRIHRRLEELGLGELAEYRTYLESHPAEWEVLDRCCRISISRFYRNRGVSDRLRDEILPELARLAIDRGDDALRCWSAGCASGEEVYTVAILWETCLRSRFGGLSLDLVATDVDEHMLARASQARYSATSLKDAPREWLATMFVHEGDDYILRPDLVARVEFLRQDIRTEMPDGPFHLVLCRNLVFTYFDEAFQRTLLRRILDRIVPGGLLMTGQQEPLPGGVEGLEPVGRRQGAYRAMGGGPWRG